MCDTTVFILGILNSVKSFNQMCQEVLTRVLSISNCLERQEREVSFQNDEANENCEMR